MVQSSKKGAARDEEDEPDPFQIKQAERLEKMLERFGDIFRDLRYENADLAVETLVQRIQANHGAGKPTTAMEVVQPAEAAQDTGVEETKVSLLGCGGRPGWGCRPGQRYRGHLGPLGRSLDGWTDPPLPRLSLVMQASEEHGRDAKRRKTTSV